eukprot:tig00020684_g12909.t1
MFNAFEDGVQAYGFNTCAPMNLFLQLSAATCADAFGATLRNPLQLRTLNPSHDDHEPLGAGGSEPIASPVASCSASTAGSACTPRPRSDSASSSSRPSSPDHETAGAGAVSPQSPRQARSKGSASVFTFDAAHIRAHTRAVSTSTSSMAGSGSGAVKPDTGVCKEGASNNDVDRDVDAAEASRAEIKAENAVASERGWTTDVPARILPRISRYFSLPTEEAAKALGLSGTTMKRICRRCGVKRWPFRKFNSLRRWAAVVKGLASLQAPAGAGPAALEEGDRHLLRIIDSRLKLIQERPNEGIDDVVQILRAELSKRAGSGFAERFASRESQRKAERIFADAGIRMQ